MIRYSLSAVAALLFTVSATAQDLDVDISSDGISISKGEWYENPLIWIGAVLVIILLVLLSRRTAK